MHVARRQPETRLRRGSGAFLQEIQDTLERFLDKPWTPFGTLLDTEGSVWNRDFAPPLDVYDHDDSVVVRVDLPGVKKEDIEISVVENTLTIKGTKTAETTDGPSHSERFYGAYSRSLTIPSKIAADDVKATYKDGVLEVTLPKLPESKARQIPVKG